ncbi:MAG: hypothetical protein ACD_24C00405G0002 [uncultured bacterium]|nr:MAG: hypothetical protein ACD_24C00405G0002 [uncultured bacterium]
MQNNQELFSSENFTVVYYYLVAALFISVAVFLFLPRSSIA